MREGPAVRVEGLWKRYGLPPAVWLRGAWTRLRRRRPRFASAGNADGPDDLWALRDISFEVPAGETLGIVGRNGAGKSTLLKVLARITSPTRGIVEIPGRLFPMIELNAGVHPELTGRENVRLLGAVMGLPRREIETRMPEIEEFTELEDWFDRPVRMYSTGMLARLGFAVAVNVQSDVILIDEVFAVGDLKFRNRCLRRLKELREGGAAILLVSHNLDNLQYLTNVGILLDKGRQIAVGTPRSVLVEYERLIFHSEKDRLEEIHLRTRVSSGEVEIRSAVVLDSKGLPTTSIFSGDTIGIELSLKLRRTVSRPLFTLSILNAAGVVCVWNLSEESGFVPGPLLGPVILRAWFPPLDLVGGSYEIFFAIRDRESYETLERASGIATFAVSGRGRSRGIIEAPCQWEVVRDEVIGLNSP